MKKACVLLLLLMLMLMGCQETSSSQVLAPTSAPTDTPTMVPTATPLPSAKKQDTPPASTPSPAPTNTPTPEPTATPEPTPTPVPAPTPFTIVWMTDTQNLSREFPEVFLSMRDWILSHRESENIQFVIHTGDVVGGLGPVMAKNAADALVPVLEVIPGMIVSGNHDITKTDKHWNFSQQPYAKMVHKDGQILEENNGANVYAAYTTFHAAGTDFLVFGIGYNVICTDWMNKIIAEHPNHVVITAVHKGLRDHGTYTTETRPIFVKVMPLWPQFRLILCGHEHGTMMLTDWFDDDHDNTSERSVTTMMFNYQDDWKNGLGYMRLLRFDPADHSIEVLTYSPWYDQWAYPKVSDEENHFVLENAW